MIDNHIPPPQHTTRNREVPLPRTILQKMQVNDSVYIAGDARIVFNARSAATMYAKKSGKQFITRAERDGVRIWRVA
jgi:hypothetical protein